MAEQCGKYILLQRGLDDAGDAVTFTTGTDLVGEVGHEKNDGDIVSFATVVTTTSISADTDYYVVNSATDQYQLALTKGGAPIALDLTGSGTMNETFQNVGGIRSKSMTINKETVDVTNQDSDGWRKLLGCGTKSVSLSGSGVFENGSVIHKLRTDVMSDASATMRFVVNSDGNYFQGEFQQSSMELAGEYNGEATYSVAFESADQVSYT